MIPLIFIAIALGIGLTAYEFSPKAHTWADEHAQAIRDALAAHRAADAHIDAAKDAIAAGDQAIAEQHVQAANAAHRESAQHTATAAHTAKTEPQRAASTDSAAKVIAREEKLADIGAGQCDVRLYPHVTAQIRDALLARLHSEGMDVTGNNPWDIDTHNHDVKLRALWDSREQVLKLIVTAGAAGTVRAFLVCPEVWKRIDPIMKEIIGS